MIDQMLARVVDPEETKMYGKLVLIIDIIHNLPEIAYVAICKDGATHTVWHHQVQILGRGGASKGLAKRLDN